MVKMNIELLLTVIVLAGAKVELNPLILMVLQLCGMSNHFPAIIYIDPQPRATGVVWSAAETCNSCGSECQSACGTRHFRTCCFNYLKKRSNPAEPLPPSLDPASLRLELWLAKSRYPAYFQPRAIIPNDAIDGVDILGRNNEVDNNHDSIK